MSQTAAFDIRNSQKLRNASKKYERPAPPENPAADTPGPRLNIFERMDIPGNSRHDSSLRAVIDTVPDFRYPLLFIIFHVIKLYADKEQQAAPLMTPASFTYYCMLLTYAFLLVNDYHGRPSPSHYASNFMDSDARTQLFEHLKKAYVPPFMLTLFHGLTDTSDPRRPGLQYFATLAGSRFATDFGRLIPPQIFCYMHNISADQDTSRNAATSMEQLTATEIFSEPPLQSHIAGHFLGAPSNNATYRNWLYKAVLTLFSPVCAKSLLRRTNIEPINVYPTRISSDQSVNNDIQTGNLYTIFLNANKKNVKHTQNFVNEFSAIAKNIFEAKFQLGAVPDDLSGISIMTHSYSQFALPTWTSKSYDNTKDPKYIDSEAFASKIKFLQEQTYPSTGNGKLRYPQDDSKINKLLYLVLNSNHDSTKEPRDDTFITFDPETHVSPGMLWLQPYTSGDQAIGYSMISGLNIESFEIDGSSVPAPNPAVGLRHANVQFMQGALPLTHVIQGINAIGISPFDRKVVKRNNQKISVDFFNMAENRLPRFDLDTADPVPTSIPGFTTVDHVRSFFRAATKWSFMSDSAPPNDYRAVVWSPYRYVTSDEDEIPAEDNILMFTNEVTKYGTSVPLTGTEHASVIIPIS